MSVSSAVERGVGVATPGRELRLRVVDVPGPRIVKRYGNRKLYDTAASRYVKLDEIADLIRNGVEVKVIEHGSGRDITTAALAHIIFEEEAARAQRSAGILADVIRGRPTTGNPAAQATRGDRHDEVLDRAEGRLDRALGQAHRTRAAVAATLSATQGTLQRLREIASARVEVAHDVCDGLGRARRDLERIARRLDVLHERLRTLDA